MTTREKVDALIEQVSELPADAQAEFVDSLLDMRAEQLGIYHLDDDERAALARSAEDVRHGRFASDAEVEATSRAPTMRTISFSRASLLTTQSPRPMLPQRSKRQLPD
jgi:hypothetical protein